MSDRRSILAVLSGKGGVGKTTISAGLGCVYAALGYRVLIIDLDVGLRNLDLQFQVQGDILFDLSHVLDGYVPLSEAVLTIPEHPNLYMLASSLYKNFSALDPQQLKTMMIHARELFDIVILDAPAGADPLLLEIAHYCDAALLVSHPYQPSLRSIDKLLGILNKKLPKYWIINRMPTSLPQNYKNIIAQEIDFPLTGTISELPTILHDQALNKPLNYKFLFKQLKPIALRLLGNNIASPVLETTLDAEEKPDTLTKKNWKESFVNFVFR